MKRECKIRTPLGEMSALLEKDAVSELLFPGQKYATEIKGELQDDPDHPVFRELRRQLEAYFAGKLLTFDLPLAPKGTEFRMAVWKLLQEIPFGETVTYGSLAGKLTEIRHGCTPAAQAVGGAVGHNPISIIIPCHRVVGADGTLTGYAGGLDRKSFLLALENAKLPDKVKK